MEWEIKYNEEKENGVEWSERHIAGKLYFSLIKLDEKTKKNYNDGYKYRMASSDQLWEIMRKNTLPETIQRHSDWEDVYVTNDLEKAIEMLEKLKVIVKEKLPLILRK